MHRRERRCITLLFRFFFEVVDDVADSDETAYIVLVDLDVEFLFAQKDEIITVGDVVDYLEKEAK